MNTDASFTTTAHLENEAETGAFARRVAPCFVATRGIVTLTGPLGAGKTTFVRALLNALGHHGPVKSPTYTLVEPYPDLAVPVYHFDCYRFADPEEFRWGGFDEYFQPENLCLVEWPEKAHPYLPSPDWQVRITIEATGSRLLTLGACSTAAKRQWPALG